MHAHTVTIYRPVADHRRNIQGVLLPLTAAIYVVFGNLSVITEPDGFGRRFDHVA